MTFTLTPTADRLNTPAVYSYILLYNKLNYYNSGTFSNVSNAIPAQPFTFDQVRVAVTGATIPTGTSLRYEAALPGTTTPVSLGTGTVVSLGRDVDTLTFQGYLTASTDSLYTPSLSEVTLTAIGETALANALEAVSDVSPSVTGTLTASTDRVVGSYSLKVDHTSVGSGTYSINAAQVFDATKLPLVQIWVKPLTAHAFYFTSYDMVELRNERITSDMDGDGYFEVGEDLILNKWNLLLLDLRKTQYGGVAKDAKGLKLAVTLQGTKLLIDGVSSAPYNDTQYVYDAAGNRTQYVEKYVERGLTTGLTTTYQYESGSNRLLRWDRGDGHAVYTYDSNGNLTKQEVQENGESYSLTYVYNELNQLTRVVRNNILVIADYFYDHAGLRYKKKDYATGKTTLYVYGTGTEPMYEEVFNTTRTPGTPVAKTAYLNMGTKRLARSENGSISYYFADHLGSTRIVMNAAGVCSYNEYAPFGADFWAANSERYKFTGKEDDGATGLQYFNARYYDPAVGRFVSEDPAKDGWNWYQYCSNSPVNFIDPTGFQALDNDEDGQIDDGACGGAPVNHGYATGSGSGLMPNFGAGGKAPDNPGNIDQEKQYNATDAAKNYGSEGKGAPFDRSITNTGDLNPESFKYLKDNGVIAGSRSGTARPVMGPPNSFYRTANGVHAYIYDGYGKLIYDIDSSRVKGFTINVNPKGQEFYQDFKLEGSVPSYINDIFGW